MPSTPPGIAEGFPGQRMIVLPRPIVAQALADRLPVGMTPSDIGFFPNARSHYFERPRGCSQLILILCVRGAGWLCVNGEDYEVRPGQLAVVLPNEPHRYGANDENPWTIYWCHAAGEAAERIGQMLRSYEASPIQHVADQTRLVCLFEEVLDELDRGYGLNHLVPAALALAHLLGLALSGRRAQANVADPIRQAIEYMRRHESGAIRVPQLAGMLNLSVSHFSAVFKRATGFPPLDYFLRMKMRRACELLDLTQLPVKEIAEEIGFPDPLYFSRAFRRIQGMSPAEYRRNVKG